MSKHNNTNSISSYRVRRLIIYVLAMGLLQISCAMVEPIQALGHTWRAYERTIRWGDVSGASTYLRHEAAKKSKYPKDLKQLKVTGYEVVQKSINEDTMIAHQTVKIRYYFEDNPVEKSFIDNQEWQYDDNKTRWFLVTAVPQFSSR